MTIKLTQADVDATTEPLAKSMLAGMFDIQENGEWLIARKCSECGAVEEIVFPAGDWERAAAEDPSAVSGRTIHLSGYCREHGATDDD